MNLIFDVFNFIIDAFVSFFNGLITYSHPNHPCIIYYIILKLFFLKKIIFSKYIYGNSKEFIENKVR